MSSARNLGIQTEFTRREALAVVGGGLALSLHAACSPDVGDKSPMAESDVPIHYWSLMETARALRAGDLSPVDLTRRLLNRIEALDGDLESYATVTTQRAMDSARAAEIEIEAGNYRGALHGVPIGIKDLCYTRGVRTMGGMAVYADFIPDYDATVVARLEAAGAIALGKLNLSEGAWNPHHPNFGVPKNPWDRSRWTGLSSSGSGVATAAGLCYGSLGTDTGGSIRYPCAANGLVGLKPTYGRVSRYGVLPLAHTLDHVGPITRRVADAAVMFETIAGADPNDPTSLDAPVPSMVEDLGRGVRGLRLGWDRGYTTTDVEPRVSGAIEAALAELESQGAEIVDAEMPEYEEAIEAWFTICYAEAAAAHRETYPSRIEEYGPGFQLVLEQGANVTGAEVGDALRIRTGFSTRLRHMLSTVDAFICPAVWCAPGVYADAEVLGAARPVDPSPWDHDVFTKPTDLSGSPSLTLPCGFTAEGLPLAFQLIGSHRSEPLLLQIGQAYEQATEWHLRHPEV